MTAKRNGGYSNCAQHDAAKKDFNDDAAARNHSRHSQAVSTHANASYNYDHDSLQEPNNSRFYNIKLRNL